MSQSIRVMLWLIACALVAGAVGDGKADDTKALQRGLDDLVKHEKACVLHIPAGTYRLTAPKGFAFLASGGDHPDPAKSRLGGIIISIWEICGSVGAEGGIRTPMSVKLTRS